MQLKYHSLRIINGIFQLRRTFVFCTVHVSNTPFAQSLTPSIQSLLALLKTLLATNSLESNRIASVATDRLDETSRVGKCLFERCDASKKGHRVEN